MAVHASHAALPYIVKGARYSYTPLYLDSSGTPTDPVTPDTEISKDAAAFADCAEEVTTISGSNGAGLHTLSGAETNCSVVVVAAKVASGPKTTLLCGSPRVLPVLYSGTASAGAADSITLASDVPAVASLLIGCIVKTTGGTGGGGTGGANNQARVITGYSAARVATVTPDWEVTPDNTTTYEVLLTEMAHLARVVDKTGFALASDGLDSISTTAPAGVASNFREMIVQTWRRFFKKHHYDKAGNTIKTYADNGSSVLTTQTATSSDTDDDVGAAT